MLEAILESAAGAIIAIDENGIVHSVNPATEKLFGYAAAELVGRNVNILMPEPDHSRHDGYLKHHLATGERHIIGIGRETHARRKDGTIFPIHLSVSGFLVDQKHYFAGIIHDLSARTRLEAEIDRQALLFQTVFDHVPEALLIADPSFHVLLLNPAAERLLVGSDETLAGANLETIFADPQEFVHVGERLDALGAAREPATAPMMARLKGPRGETFPGEVIAAPISGASGMRTGLVILVRDLTNELRREEALLKSQRLEAIGQLTGGIAHDFNNLLTIVTGNLELMDELVTDERARDHARRAQQAADAGARLTNRLLTFARRRRLEPQDVNLNDQVRVMTELLQRTLGETVQLTTVLAADLWTARVDPSEVENAVVNLAINARDAMPNGGKLVIETSNSIFDGQAAGPEAAIVAGDYVRLSVSDNGVGMSRETLARAFEPFFTTKPPGRGTGLGLSTIYGFVKQSNGNVTIYSEVEKGTTVNIYLPRRRADVRPDAQRQPVWVTTAGEGMTILLVEDNPEVRAVALGRLQRLGYGVIEAYTAAEAISILESDAAVTAVFSDVVMPGGLSGFDLARWMRANRPELPVLLTSGFAEDIARGDEPDANQPPMLRKPYTQAELAKMLRQAMVVHGKR
jgi:PAS domain S-box-containing protein